jgi:hypothetical protein
MNHPRLLLLALLSLTVPPGCGGEEKYGFAGTDPGGGGGGADGADGTDTDPPDSGGGDGGDGGVTTDESFEEPGDVVGFTDEDGAALVDLSDDSGESNKGHEFLLILVNTDSSDLGFELQYVAAPEDESDTGGAAGPPGPRAARAEGPRTSPHRAALREHLKATRVGARPEGPPPPPFAPSDVGNVVRSFKVRDDIDDDTSAENVDATLWAVGDYVDIWVDNGWAINWDYECDGVPDEVDSRGAFGFDNCDLSLIADAIDANIHPTLTNTFGSLPDVNGDSKVSVVISPWLNGMTRALDEDDDNYGGLVRSYVDPEVDLNDYDFSENPNSNEQEVIFVFAPDQAGFANPTARTTVDSYTQVELLAEVARGYQRLISYKYHCIDSGDPEAGEVTWVQEGLSALAADLTGFGSVYYDDVWDYLDRTHGIPLVDEGELEVINTESWGAQYLFFRWLYEHAGELSSLGQEAGEGGVFDTGGSGLTGGQLIGQLVQTTDTGTDNIEAATGQSFRDLVVYWQVALATTGRTTAAGDPLVDPDSWPPYGDPTEVTAPTSSPSPGDLYGANGYQQGIAVAGLNRFMEGGFDAVGAAENTDRRVLASGSDAVTMVTGFDFFGQVAGDYGVQVVRLADIPFDEGALRIDADGGGFTGVVVRLEDPTVRTHAVENIFSSTDPTNLPLPTLPTDGSPIRALGAIQDSGVTYVKTSPRSETLVEVYDTDRWVLDLTDRAPTDTVKIVAHLERRYVDSSGKLGPSDPWLALVPEAWVPSPSVASVNYDTCPTAAFDFYFPATVLEHLYYQVFLSSDAYGSDLQTSDTGDSGGADGTGGDGGGGDGGGGADGGGGEGPFDPCGSPAPDPTTCDVDWDLDGVLDDDEPLPETFLEQVQAMQCTLAGGDPGAFTPAGADIFDVDHTDEDEESAYDRTVNMGGAFGESDEEALLIAEVAGGSRYILVVGAGDDVGPYEVTLIQAD